MIDERSICNLVEESAFETDLTIDTEPLSVRIVWSPLVLKEELAGPFLSQKLELLRKTVFGSSVRLVLVVEVSRE